MCLFIIFFSCLPIGILSATLTVFSSVLSLQTAEGNTNVNAATVKEEFWTF